jgi:tRNA-2-methylthio-N6-dimethylallyladenosine synthase
MVERFVDPSIVGERFDRLKAVLDRSAVRRHAARIGRIEEVVVEGTSKRNRERLTGRTRQNKLVHFDAPSLLRPGTYATVQITDAARFHLSGHLLDAGPAPTHKVRLAVTAA